MDATIDEVKNYWDRRPCNIRHSDKPVGSKIWFEETEARKYFVEPHIPGFAEFEKWRDRRVLEVGCGIGIDTVNFVRAGAGVTAVDLSIESLGVAASRLRSESLSANLVQGNAEELLWPPYSFDLVYAFGSIHHSPNPEKIIRRARASSKPSATLKIMVYNKISWKVLWIFLKYGYGRFWKLDELVQKYSEAETGCPVTHTYSRKSITDLLKRNDYTVTSIKVDHIFPYSIPAYIQYQYKKVWYFRWMPRKLFRWLETHFGWHLLVEATCP